jgi:GNAT superfamily N-acetyltransferase
MASELCKILEWDSRHFGIRLARVLPRSLSRDDFHEVMAWCAKEKVKGLYYLCPAEERESARWASRHGFECVDVRVEFEKRLVGWTAANTPSQVRLAKPADIAALKAIARTSHRDTRFYADPHFAQEASDRLYEIWIEKSCTDAAGCVWTADDVAGQPIGYVTCTRESDKVGRIGLVAIREDLRGQGWGHALMQRALQWFVENGYERVQVATQGANGGALRLYGRLGFVPVSVALWFHKWFEDAAL